MTWLTLVMLGMRNTRKLDGEPAVKALKGALALKRGRDTSIVRSPARESKSSGAVERAIQSWKGQTSNDIAFGGQTEDSKYMLIIRCCLGWQFGLARLLANIRYVMVGLLMNE